MTGAYRASAHLKPGKYKSSVGSEECVACAAGTYGTLEAGNAGTLVGAATADLCVQCSGGAAYRCSFISFVVHLALEVVDERVRDRRRKEGEVGDGRETKREERQSGYMVGRGVLSCRC